MDLEVKKTRVTLEYPVLYNFLFVLSNFLLGYLLIRLMTFHMFSFYGLKIVNIYSHTSTFYILHSSLCLFFFDSRGAIAVHLLIYYERTDELYFQFLFFYLQLGIICLHSNEDMKQWKYNRFNWFPLTHVFLIVLLFYYRECQDLICFFKIFHYKLAR